MSIVVRCVLALTVVHFLSAIGVSADAEQSTVSKQGATAGKKLIQKRRDYASEDELRKELQSVHMLGFDLREATIARNVLERATHRPLQGSHLSQEFGIEAYEKFARTLRQPHPTALPWRKGGDCQSLPDAARWLSKSSRDVRDCVRSAAFRVQQAEGKENKESFDEAWIRELNLKRDKWNTPDCIPTLVQMMQAESAEIRYWLVKQLSSIPGTESTEALARRAIFDLSRQVRERAIVALRDRPTKEYQQILVEGLRWPWRAVADHAAEAIAALQLKEMTPQLISLLREPAPALPYEKIANGKREIFVKELVKINHLSNCTLCHAPSFSPSDPARGEVPSPGAEMPREKYYDMSWVSVRADVTYLRQDFSVTEPVDNPGKWPANQRFDYFLRERPATAKEKALFQSREELLDRASPNREAVLFALHAQDWSSFVGSKQPSAPLASMAGNNR